MIDEKALNHGDILEMFILRAQKCQKWEIRFFITCPCPKIGRVEAVRLSLSNYTFTITIFSRVLWEIWINFVKKKLSITA